MTSECGPPRGSDPAAMTKKAQIIKDYVDAINITDNQTSVTRLCSLASCIHLKMMGLDPVLQMVVRDRNRIALQSDILGAASFDINNILCLSGDHQTFGDNPKGQNVFDIDSMQLIQTVRRMSDEGKFLGGDEIKRPPKMFVGAAANPFADPFEIRVPPSCQEDRCRGGVHSDPMHLQPRQIRTLDETGRRSGSPGQGLHPCRSHPSKSAGMAKYMKNRVPGMDVPDDVVKRMSGVPKENQAEEGIKICIESIQRLKEVEGVRGFHIMAIEWEEKVPEIVEKSGLFPRPQVA